MASQYAVDDSEWLEVRIIKRYAVFMGYVMMGIRGLGVLIVTWTTVVLLGGFVSDLGRNDFWCLTWITLVQTAGVFNFLLNKKRSDMLHSYFGLVAAISVTFKGRALELKSAVIERTWLVIEGLVLVIIVCLLGVLYMFGMYISAGVSLWRLIEHDFGNEGGANQKPALQLLYGLAVAQGVLFCYKVFRARGWDSRMLSKFAAAELPTVDKELVGEYVKETIAGCDKDPSFATGRNLVTYGVGLMMEAKSNEGFIAGIRVLGGAIKGYLPTAGGRKVLAKHLLTSRSDFWSHMIQRLLEIVGSESPYSIEVREHAARIVALIARTIPLQQFPGVIECISSVLDELEGLSADQDYSHHPQQRYSERELFSAYVGVKLEDYERVELLEEYELLYLYESKGKARGSREMDKDLNGLHEEAANIIQQLAANEDNRRIMSKAVIPKFGMSLHKLHRDKDHGVILEKYWVQWLVAAIKETSSSQLEVGQSAARAAGAGGGRSGEEILNRTVKRIFDCLDCGVVQKINGVQILLYLSSDMSFILDDSESSRRRLSWILLLAYRCYGDTKSWNVISAFTGRSMDMRHDLFSKISRLAGEKLWDMLREKHATPPEETAMLLGIFQDITRGFVKDSEDMSIRIHAAMIMGYISTLYYGPYSMGGNKKMEEILIGAITQVVKEILAGNASIGEERQAHDLDVEKGISEDDILESSMNKERLRKALVSLCRDGYMKGSNLRPEFEKVATKICKEKGKSFEYFKSLLV